MREHALAESPGRSAGLRVELGVLGQRERPSRLGHLERLKRRDVTERGDRRALDRFDLQQRQELLVAARRAQAAPDAVAVPEPQGADLPGALVGVDGRLGVVVASQPDEPEAVEEGRERPFGPNVFASRELVEHEFGDQLVVTEVGREPEPAAGGAREQLVARQLAQLGDQDHVEASSSRSSAATARRVSSSSPPLYTV